MFLVKICGITNIDDACATVDAGAGAIGFNFFTQSCRFVDIEIAQQIAAAVPPHVLKVGVFVNHSAREITETVERAGLDAVQLHGDEVPELLQQLPEPLQIIRAHRCGRDGLSPLFDYLEACRGMGRLPDALLIDADAGTNYGGSGERADWDRIVRERGGLGMLPLILAGGLTPKNVAAAIAAVRPDGVDVASGVELEPGYKDTTLITNFVATAREAFSEM